MDWKLIGFVLLMVVLGLIAFAVCPHGGGAY
jgi:hypothetical protein